MRSSPPSGVTPASTTMTDDGSSEAVDGVSGDVGHCRPAGIGCVYPTFTRQTEPRATRLADRPSGRLSREDDRIWDSNDTERREPSTRTRLRANEGEISDHGERSHNCQRLATARCARLGDTQHDDERLEGDLTRLDFQRNFPKQWKLVITARYTRVNVITIANTAPSRHIRSYITDCSDVTAAAEAAGRPRRRPRRWRASEIPPAVLYV